MGWGVDQQQQATTTHAALPLARAVGAPPVLAAARHKRTRTHAAASLSNGAHGPPPRSRRDAAGGGAEQEARRHTHGTLGARAHAAAGAAAGCVVSAVLHPVDTVKTVLQAAGGKAGGGVRTVPRRVAAAARSVAARGGPRAFYRGIGANLASSAPISAIYAATYEAVRARLRQALPVAERRPWVADCVAGACASVATSVVYTPSECLKQRMQCGQYPNPFAAARAVLAAAGPAGLYRGWGAVLCRNIPQSAIKFYTFEALKRAHRERNGGRDPEGATTLLLGGTAGCTAAFVTTPFDVVKTRLQTRALELGSSGGVFKTAAGIVAAEGPQGLYRGLAPRLVIYMSQGAIFFASYEGAKLLLLEAAKRRARREEAEAKALALGA